MEDLARYKSQAILNTARKEAEIILENATKRAQLLIDTASDSKDVRRVQRISQGDLTQTDNPSAHTTSTILSQKKMRKKMQILEHFNVPNKKKKKPEKKRKKSTTKKFVVDSDLLETMAMLAAANARVGRGAAGSPGQRVTAALHYANGQNHPSYVDLSQHHSNITMARPHTQHGSSSEQMHQLDDQGNNITDPNHKPNLSGTAIQSMVDRLHSHAGVYERQASSISPQRLQLLTQLFAEKLSPYHQSPLGGYSAVNATHPLPRIRKSMPKGTNKDLLAEEVKKPTLVREWGVSQVIQWIHSLKLTKDYAPLIAEHHLVGSVLLTMTSDDWKCVGVTIPADIAMLDSKLPALIRQDLQTFKAQPKPKDTGTRGKLRRALHKGLASDYYTELLQKRLDNANNTTPPPSGTLKDMAQVDNSPIPVAMADTAGLLNMCTGSVHNPYTGGTVCFSLEETESSLQDPMSVILPKTRDIGLFTLEEHEEWKAPTNIIPIHTTEFGTDPPGPPGPSGPHNNPHDQYTIGDDEDDNTQHHDAIPGAVIAVTHSSPPTCAATTDHHETQQPEGTTTVASETNTIVHEKPGEQQGSNIHELQQDQPSQPNGTAAQKVESQPQLQQQQQKPPTTPDNIKQQSPDSVQQLTAPLPQQRPTTPQQQPTTPQQRPTAPPQQQQRPTTPSHKQPTTSQQQNNRKQQSPNTLQPPTATPQQQHNTSHQQNTTTTQKQQPTTSQPPSTVKSLETQQGNTNIQNHNNPIPTIPENPSNPSTGADESSNSNTEKSKEQPANPDNKDNNNTPLTANDSEAAQSEVTQQSSPNLPPNLELDPKKRVSFTTDNVQPTNSNDTTTPQSEPEKHDGSVLPPGSVEQQSTPTPPTKQEPGSRKSEAKPPDPATTPETPSPAMTKALRKQLLKQEALARNLTK